MTPKVKERTINIGLYLLSGAIVAYFTYSLNTGEGRSVRIQSELKEKAPYEYVDKQDAVVQKNLDDFKVEQNQRHISEYEQTDRYLRLMMDHFNIKYKEDEK